MNKEILDEAELRMEESLENLEKRFGTIRTGRANPSALDGVVVEYYGSQSPLKSLATISVPEGNQLLIKPFDKHALGEMEKAILKSNLGFTPTNDGETLRIIIPPVTEDRRRELTKQAKAVSEEGRIAIRNIRHDAMDDIDKLEDISEDDQKLLEKQVQDLTNEYNKKIDEMLKQKDEELMTV